MNPQRSSSSPVAAGGRGGLLLSGLAWRLAVVLPVLAVLGTLLHGSLSG